MKWLRDGSVTRLLPTIGLGVLCTVLLVRQIQLESRLDELAALQTAPTAQVDKPVERVEPVSAPSRPRTQQTPNPPPTVWPDVPDDPVLREQALADQDRIMARAQEILNELSEEELWDWWEDKYRSDRVDGEWQQLGRDLIAPAVNAALPPDAVLHAMDCRGHYCRIEITYRRDMDHNAFAGALFPARLDGEGIHSVTSGMMTARQTYLDDGRFRAVMFIARKGSLLVPH